MSTTSDETRDTTLGPEDEAPEGIAPDPMLTLASQPAREAAGEAQARVEVPEEGVAPDPILTMAPPAVTPEPLAPAPGEEPVYRGPHIGWRIASGVLALAALAMAMISAFVVEGVRGRETAPPAISWWLLGLAGLALAAAMWPVPRVISAIPVPFWRAFRGMRRRPLFVALLALAIVSNLAAVPLFILLNNNPDPTAPAQGWLINTGSWLLYIISLLLYGAAWVVWERSAPGTTPSAHVTPPGGFLPRRTEWVILAVLFLAALLLRVINLDDLPQGLWFDEAQNGIVARRLLSPEGAHVTYIGDQYTQMGMLDLYFTGTIINFFGNGIWQVRLLAALSGTLAVPLLYLLASRIYGWRVGLAAAGFALVSTWHITFSRFASGPLMFTVMMDLASYLCIAQGLRTGRMGFYAAGGILLGLGLHAYYPAKYAFVVLAAVLAHRLITERMRIVRALRPALVVVGLGVAMAFMPVALFALQHFDVYNSRVNTVSIFNEFHPSQVNEAINTSIRTHMLMFNWAGDRNGRHSLPGAPILDWLTAALFFAGLATCIWRAWRWQYFFPLVWFVGNMSGGVLSLLFEAPQGARTMENSVVTALFAGIFLGEFWAVVSRALSPQRPDPRPVDVVPYPEEPLWRKVAGRFRPALAPAPSPARASTAVSTTLPVRSHAKRRPSDAGPQSPVGTLPVRSRASNSKMDEVKGHSTPTAPQPVMRRRFTGTARHRATSLASIAGIVLFVAWASTMTIPRYFQEQAGDRSVWKEMYAAEEETARLFQRYNATHTIYASPILYTLPPSRYLVPDAGYIEWPGMHAFPLTSTGRDVVIMLDPPSAGDLAMIARIYPNARFAALQAPSHPDPLMFSVFIPDADIRSRQGARITLLGDDRSRPLIEEQAVGASFDWNSRGVTSGTVRLSTTLKIGEYGPYQFALEHANGADTTAGSLMVDGYEIRAGVPISLASGLHSVVATDTLRVGESPSRPSRILWGNLGVAPSEIPANMVFDPRSVEPHGLTGYFRDGTLFEISPRAARVDPVISAYFHQTPLPRPYTAEWLGRIYIPEAGTYLFGTEQLSRSRLFIDGQELISNTAANNLIENSIELTVGYHNIRILYEDFEGYSHIYLYWTPPGRERAIVPSVFLWPQMGSYPERPESGQFPTLDQYDGKQLPPDRLVAGTRLPAPGQKPDDPAPVPQSNQPPPQMEGTPIEALYALDLPNGRLSGPFSVAADAAGNTYVFTTRDGKIHKFGPQGELLIDWVVTSGDGSRPLTELSAMMVEGEKLFALDAESSELIEFSLDGQMQGRRRMCECYFPRGMYPAGDGNFWVSDTGGGRVIKVSATGDQISVLGERGSEPGKFIEPTSLYQAPSGVLYVADVGNSRVQTFSPDGSPLAQWSMGVSDSRDGNRLTADGENVLVTQGESRSIVRYDAQGKELGRWSYARNNEIATPASIAPLPDGRYAVLFFRQDYGVVFKP
jgi:hypothetical protein